MGLWILTATSYSAIALDAASLCSSALRRLTFARSVCLRALSFNNSSISTNILSGSARVIGPSCLLTLESIAV